MIEYIRRSHQFLWDPLPEQHQPISPLVEKATWMTGQARFPIDLPPHNNIR